MGLRRCSSTSAIICVALVIPARGDLKKLGTSHVDEVAQDSVDTLADRLISRFFQRTARAVSPFSRLDATTVGKAGHLARSSGTVSRPQVSSMAVPAAYPRGAHVRQVRVLGRGCGDEDGDGPVQLPCATASPSPTLHRRAVLGHGTAATFAAVLGSLSARPFGPAAAGIGPQSVPLEVVGYEDTKCPEGVPEGKIRCITVRARGTNPEKESAFNGEVFGRVRFENDESALYGDFSESTDSGKMADLQEFKPGQQELTFILKLDKARPNDKLKFVNMKARIYPGMRASFRQTKPVTETCDPEIEACLDAEDQVPF